MRHPQTNMFFFLQLVGLRLFSPRMHTIKTHHTKAYNNSALPVLSGEEISCAFNSTSTYDVRTFSLNALLPLHKSYKFMRLYKNKSLTTTVFESQVANYRLKGVAILYQCLIHIISMLNTFYINDQYILCQCSMSF